MLRSQSWRIVQGQGKRAIARIARRVLPRSTVRLSHVEPGITLRVDLRRHVMFWSGGLSRFEPAAVRVLRAAVCPGDHVVDLGANVGFFSTLFSRWVGDEGKVLAVEPEAENLSMLRTNLRANRCDNVVVCDCAAGPTCGSAGFSVDEATGATGRLGNGVTAGEIAVGTHAVRVVPTRVETIDSLVATHGIVPRVVKMDIEGSEADALEGAGRTLADHRPVIVSELTGIAGTEVIERLVQARYQMWDVETSKPVGPEDRPFMIVAIPDQDVDSARGKSIQEALEASNS
jgi:FkbM family methyltransferase